MEPEGETPESPTALGGFAAQSGNRQSKDLEFYGWKKQRL
jgi:hypothetical protein